MGTFPADLLFTLKKAEQVHYVNEEYDEALKNYTLAVTLEVPLFEEPTSRACA